MIECGRSAAATAATTPDGECIPECGDIAVVPLDGQGQWPGGAFAQRQPHLRADPEAGRGRALDLHQRRRRLGPSDPPPFRGGRHHRPRRRIPARDRAAGAQGRVAAAARRTRQVPGPLRRVRRRLRQPLPQYHRTKTSPCCCAIQLLTPPPGDPDYKGLPHFVPTRTPIPGPRGVTWKDPEILPEADPRSPNYIPPSGGGSGTG